MADSLIFDPTSEFIVLETFDFEEEIQRPLQLRFFTLEEQLIDFFEKHLPPGKPTKFELNKLKDYQANIKTAYDKYITVSESNYIIDTTRHKVNVSWIDPVYSDFKYKPYSYTKEFAPLFEKTAIQKPNYYPLLINSLPSPYISTGEGRPLYDKLELVNEKGEKPIRGLMKFQRTKQLNRDDGTFEIVSTNVSNTQNDDLNVKGYYLKERPLEIPRPFDHPFLKSNKAGFIESDVPIEIMYPSIGTILEHAIPTTTDPYIHGKKYLNLYDVSFQDIEWSDWKQRFPPVDTIHTANIQAFTFPPKEEVSVPGDILQKIYTKWYAGYHQRKWLSLQSDAGRFIQVLLRSISSKNGVLASPPFEGPSVSHPVGSREVCMALTSDFDSFLSSGLYRPNKDKNGFDTGGVCVPVGSIQQEKAADAYKDRIGWKESTEHDMVTEYTRLLKLFTSYEPVDIVTYEKFGRLAESEKRQDILNILDDEMRTPEDKASAIELLVRNAVLIGSLYTDVQSRFIVCLHTLSYLRDPSTEFFDKWTNVRDGERVCKHCGEVVSKEVLVTSDSYDDDGHLVISREKLDQGGISSSTNSILQLKAIFDLQNSGEFVLYFLISLLQVVPYEQQVLPILQLIRKITQSLRSRAASNSKITKTDQDRIEGILGICGTVIVLQSHDPILIPKKTVGNKMFNTSGYPRDTDNTEISPVLDSILITLKKTLESFRTELKGGIGALSAEISKLGKVRKETLVYLAVFASQFKLLLESAKDRYVVPEEIELNDVRFPILRPESNLKISDISVSEYTLETKFPSSSWTNKHSMVLPTPLKIDTSLPSPYRTNIETKVNPPTISKLSDKEIQKLVSAGLPTGFPILTEFMKLENDLNSLSVLTLRLLDILSTSKLSSEFQKGIRTQFINLDYSESSSLLRDISKGLLFKLLHKVKDDGLARMVNETLKNDLTMKMLLLSKKKAEDEEFTLRTNETNLLKKRYREMTDTQREITKMLVDIGISDFIVTNEDREIFAKRVEKDVEREYLDLEAAADINRPEEGYNDLRDYVENGDLPQNDQGGLMEVDRGDYGDRAVRDYNDYTATAQYDDEN
jgi:hypothetical protein